MDPILGQLMLAGFNFAPQGWLPCDGRLLPISQYTALFSLLGTQYGGNGVNNFALPDLRGRAPIHMGQGPGLDNYVQGELGGVEKVTLTTANMPPHNHLLTAHAGEGDAVEPQNAIFAGHGNVEAHNAPFSHGAPNATLAPAAVSVAGGGIPVETRSPYITMNWLIAVEGMYPTRP